MSDDLQQVSGGCYCGRVRYRASGVSRQVTECHCSECRKQAGHRHASTGAKSSDIEIDGTANVTWYRASPDAERGFCSTCGSHLFWKPSNEDYIAILAASIDEPTGLRMAKHIFVDDKGDYYEITDGLPQFAGYDKPLTSE
ncbi:MAG: GFA family protein [Proteobacteria bacterium]|nr:GFA family protein [Pseudomonadota bacterium]